MNFDEIWKFLKQEQEFFDTFKKFIDFKVDYKNKVYFFSEEWFADPVYFMLMLFRAKFASLGPSQDPEYTRIKKLLYNVSAEFPFRKKDYDEYTQNFIKNQNILIILEDVLGAEDNEFKIPSKQFAKEKFRNTSESIESIFSSLYVYEGKVARYYVDIYDNITGFDIFLDSGPIFIKASGKDTSAFNEEKLRNSPIDSIIDVYSIDTPMKSIKSRNTSVFIDKDSEFSMRNIVSRFSMFNLKSDDEYFISSIAKSLTENMKNGDVITINSKSFTEYIANELISLSFSKTPNSLKKMVDLAKLSSHLTKVERTSIIEQVSQDLSQDVMDMVVPYMEKEEMDVVKKVTEMLNESHIEMTSKIIKLGRDTGTVRSYNKIFNYYFDMSMNLSGISNVLIPELGGIRKIINLLSLTDDDTPANFPSLEAFIGTVLLKVVHIEFSSLPVFNDFLKSGIHVIKNEASINSKTGIYGNGKNRSVDGWCFDKSDLDILIPAKRPTKIEANAALKLINKSLSKFIKTSNDDVDFSALMLASLMVIPLMSKGESPSVAFIADDDILLDSFSEYLFKGAYRFAEMINTDSGYVIDNLVNKRGSPLVCKYSGSPVKSIESSIRLKSSSEVISRFKSTEEIIYRTNDAPLILVSNKKVAIKDTVVFNIPIYELSSGEFMIEQIDDCSGIMATYFVNSFGKIRTIEDKLISELRTRIKNGYGVKNHSYYYFFFQLLPSMVVLELLGMKDAWEFHDDIVLERFGNENSLNIKTVRNIVLSSMVKKFSVSELLSDSLRDLESNGSVFFGMFMIDKLFYMSYLDKDDTDNYVIAFSISELYKSIGKDFEMSLSEFSNFVKSDSSYIKYDNAYRNYRMGFNKEITVIKAFFAEKDIPKDDFAALKINKNDI